MNTLPVPSTDTSTQIIESASLFTDFLASEAVEPVRKSISIIPNVVADILDTAVKCKTLKLQDKQFKRKADLAQQYLTIQDRHSQRQSQVEIERIHRRSEIDILEIERKHVTDLAEIKKNGQIAIQQIQLDEQIKKAEIISNYKLSKQKLENEKRMFLAALHESSKRFDRQMRNSEKLQAEFSDLISVIVDKISKGQATQFEYSWLNHLTKLKVQALEKSFDISDGFLNLFIRGE